MLNYLLSSSKTKSGRKEVIHDPESKLKIKVFDLLRSQFRPKRGEITYFVKAGNEALAFETDGYKKQRNTLILGMISWYCMYMGLVEAHIQSTWP